MNDEPDKAEHLTEASQKKISDQQPSVDKLDQQFQRKNQDVLAQSTSKPFDITTWKYYDNYVEFFKETTIESFSIEKIITDYQVASRLQKSLHQKLQQNNFILKMSSVSKIYVQKNQRIYNQIKIKISQSTPTYDVVQIFCQLHIFGKKYTVLNFKEQSPRHQNSAIGKGAFGLILQCKCSAQTDKFVVKCIKYKHQEINILKKHIKEFFICDMMSALQIGPKILKRNGFDFIIFKNCMEFEMQKCQPYKKQTVQNDLKESLIKMHLVKMMHCDLKPPNIMFSPGLNKNVIIDYGVTIFILQKWGQKSLTFFRGTYEYCGEEMKNLFVINEMSKVDLYENDVFMAKKVLWQSRQQGLMLFEFDEVNQKLSIIQEKNQTITMQNQGLFKFYYFIYKKLELSQTPVKQVEQFLAQLDQIQFKHNKIEILLKAIVFASRISPQIFEKLHSEILQSFSKYTFLKPFHINPPFNIDELADFMPHSINAGQIIKSHSFEKIYFELQDEIHLSLMYKLYLHNIENFNPMKTTKNLQYVLSHADQLDRYTDEEFFSIYLKYCSFWDSPIKISVDKKQQYSQKLSIYIKSKCQIKKLHYLNDSYLPEHDFVQKNCKHIVFMYGFLLTYCMQGEFTKFKENYGLLVLKDCIILGFQYFRFLPEYVTKYFQKAIESRSNKIVTFCIIDFIDLNLLTRNHFLYTKQTEPHYQGKFYELWLHKVFKKILSFFQLKIDSRQSYYSKYPALKFLFDETLVKRTNQIYKNTIQMLDQTYLNSVKQLISEVEKEFASQNLTEAVIVAQRAICYIVYDLNFTKTQQFADSVISNIQTFKKFSIQVNKSGRLNIFPLFSIDASFNNPAYMRNLILFDQKINCKQISDMFCIVSRPPELSQTFNETQTFRVINSLIQFPGCPSINYLMMIRALPIFESVMENCEKAKEELQCHGHYIEILSGLLKIYKRLICIFKEDHQKVQPLVDCVLYLNNLMRYNKNNFLEEERHEMAELIQSIELPQSHRHYQLLWANTKLNLYRFNSLNYLKARKQFVVLYLNMKKHNNYCFDQQESTYISEISQYYFKQIVFGSRYMFDQMIQFWEIDKLKFSLHQKYDFTFQLKSLSEVFVRKGMVREIVQLLVIYCSEDQAMLSCISQMRIFCDNYFTVASNKNIHGLLLQHLLENIDKIKKSYQKIPPKFIILYTCALHLDQELAADCKLWKKILTEMYHLHLRLLKAKNQPFSHDIIKIWEQHIWINSIKYLKSKCIEKKKIKRKFTFLIRRMLKCINTQTFFQKLQKVNYFDEFRSYFNYPSSEINRIPLRKYLKNCEVPEEFEISSQKQDFLRKYNKMVMIHEEYEAFNMLDLEMMKKYGVKDLALFAEQGLTQIFCKLRMPKAIEKYLLEGRVKNKSNYMASQNNYQERLSLLSLFSKQQEGNILARIKYASVEEQLQKNIAILKQSEQYRLCEETLDIINEILMLQKNNLLSGLQSKRG